MDVYIIMERLSFLTNSSVGLTDKVRQGSGSMFASPSPIIASEQRCGYHPTLP